MTSTGTLDVNRVLWPTDFGEPSMEALDIARALATQYEAELILYHVVMESAVVMTQAGVTGLVMAHQQEKLEMDARKKLEEAVDGRLPGDVDHRVVIESGTTAPAIVEFADETKADLIVMGTHGTTGLSRVILGSVAEEVVRKAPCPVLTVRAGTGETLETARS